MAWHGSSVFEYVIRRTNGYMGCYGLGGAVFVPTSQTSIHHSGEPGVSCFLVFVVVYGVGAMGWFMRRTGLALIQRLFVYGRLASAEIPLCYVQQLRSRADVGYVECDSISGEVWMAGAASLA